MSTNWTLDEFDAVPLVKSVLFVGDYFSLITTVEVDDAEDTDAAIKRAGEFLLAQYGWDVAAAATQGAAIMGDEID